MIDEKSKARVNVLWRYISGTPMRGFGKDSVQMMAEVLYALSVFDDHDRHYIRNKTDTELEPKLTGQLLDRYNKRATNLEPLRKALHEDLQTLCIAVLDGEASDGVTQMPIGQVTQDKMKYRIPSLPQYHVRRDKLWKELRHEVGLLKLQQNGVVIVHGMAGCGKSAMVLDVLGDDALVPYVFWINVSNQKSMLSDYTTTHCMAVLEAMDMDRKTADQVFQSPEQAITKMAHIVSNQYPFAITVLDGLDDIHIRTLYDRTPGRFIVTTTNKSLFTPTHSSYTKFVPVEPSGLTGDQGLTLFRNAFDCEPSSLPPQSATAIELTQGHPMVLGLIVSLIKAQHKQMDCERWIYYCDKLREIDTNVIRWGSDSLSPQSFAIAMQLSYDALPDYTKLRFIELTAFYRGSKVTPTLCALLWFGYDSEPMQWRNNRMEAEDILAELKRRSLVEGGAQGHAYYLHNMVANFLRDQHAKARNQDIQVASVVELHGRFVRSLVAYCGSGEVVEKEASLHLHFYLAYHHMKGGLVSQLCSYYCDLDKLQTILSNVSPSCIFADLVTYSKIIHSAITEQDSGRLKCFENFLRKNSDVLHADQVDLVQLGLAEDITSPVYDQSVTLASQRLSQDESKVYWMPKAGNVNRFLHMYDGCHCHRPVNIDHSQFVYSCPSLIFMIKRGYSDILICDGKCGKTLDILNLERGVLHMSQNTHSHSETANNLFVVHESQENLVVQYCYDCYALTTAMQCLSLEGSVQSPSSIRRQPSSYVPSANADMHNNMHKVVLPPKAIYSVENGSILGTSVCDRWLVGVVNCGDIALWDTETHQETPTQLITCPLQPSTSSSVGWVCTFAIGEDTVDQDKRHELNSTQYEVVACWADGTIFRGTLAPSNSAQYFTGYKWSRVVDDVVSFDANHNAAVLCCPLTLFIFPFTGGDNEGNLYKKHVVELCGGGEATCVALSPQGLHTCVGFNDSTVAVYCTASRQYLYRLHCAGCSVTHLAFSPDSSRLLVSSATQLVMNWDLEQVQNSWKSTNTVEHVCLMDSHDYKLRRVVTVDSNRKLKIRSVDLLGETVSIKLGTGCESMAASTQFVACAMLNGTVDIYDRNLDKVGQTQYSPAIVTLKFMQLGLLVADHKIAKIVANPGASDHFDILCDCNGNRLQFCVADSDKIVIVVDTGKIMMMDGVNEPVVDMVLEPILDVAYNAQSNVIAILTADHILTIVRMGEKHRQRKVDEGSFLVSVSPRGHIAVGGHQSTLNVYCSTKLEPVYARKERSHNSNLSVVKWTPSGTLLTLGGSLKAWCDRGELMQRYPLPGCCQQIDVTGDERNIVVLDGFGIVHSLQRFTANNQSQV